MVICIYRHEILTLSVVRDVGSVLDLHLYSSLVQDGAVGVNDWQRNGSYRAIFDGEFPLLVKGQDVERLVFFIIIIFGTSPGRRSRHRQSHRAGRALIIL